MNLFHRSNTQTQEKQDPHHITAENAYLYSPDARQSGGSLGQRLKRFWLSRTRPQQVLLVSGTVLILFSALMISFSLGHSNSGTKTSQTTLAGSQQTSGGSSSGSGSSTGITSADDANGNGVPDDEEGVVEGGEGVAWWKKLFDVVRSSDDGETSDGSGTEEEGSETNESSDGADESVDDENSDQIATDEAVEDTYDYTDETTPSSVESKKSTASNGFMVATYNIRTTNLNKWDTSRANSILNYIKSVDIVGIQEGKDDSVRWLKTKLSAAGYSAAAYSNGGEYRAIFWRNSKFSVINQGNKNLSDGRNLSWAQLKIVGTGKSVYFLNTHLRLWTTKSSGGNTTSPSKYRTKEIKEALSFIKSTAATTPVILVGDMNSRPGSDVDKLIQGDGFYSGYKIATTKNNLSYSTSVSNFNGGTTGNVHKGNSRIDHIYVKNGITMSKITIVIHQKGSDHIPVEATVSL